MCVQLEDGLSSKLTREEEEIQTLKTDCNDSGSRIQSLQAETESLRALVLLPAGAGERT